MSNLRLTRIKVIGNSRIRAQFTASLDPLINTSNIDISPIIDTIPKPEIVKVVIKNDIIDIYSQPLTPYASYIVTFKSSDLIKFKSLNGDQYLFEDGTTNAPIIKGISEPAGKIKTQLLELLKDNIYNLDGSNFASQIIDSQDFILSKALHDIGQMINDNYLEVTIKDEKKIRGTGAFDRLNEEGAFEIIRAGLTTSDVQKTTSISYDVFPTDLISLKKIDIFNEELIAGTAPGTFYGLVLNLKNKPITKATSIKFIYNNGNVVIYDINKYGYQLKDNKYDRYASKLITLEDNQIKLSDQLIDDGIIIPAVGDRIIISYEYKNLGRDIVNDSVIVSEILDSIREPAPPITNEFSISFSPVVLSNDTIPTSGGIQFLNPRSQIPFSETHPAFTKEIPFNFERLPSSEGEYSVDYSIGRVFVYGYGGNDGTGAFPPAMTYKYRSEFDKDLDYTYNTDTSDMAASPLKNMAGESVKITFNYTDDFVPGTDYNYGIHNESIDERIENRLLTLNSLRVLNTPITNAFRVINETSGEIYQITRFNNDTIYFSSFNQPRIESIQKEIASFSDVLNEILFIDNEYTNTNNIRIFKIYLQNNRIIAATEDCIGSSINTSVIFSRKDIFETELYYDNFSYSEIQNIDKITSVGDYLINYTDGIVYVGVSLDQVQDIGIVNYKKFSIKPINPHVTSVSGVYYNLNNNNINVDYSSFEDSEIIPINIEYSNERFIGGNESNPFIFSNGTITVTDDIVSIRGVYDIYDLNNNKYNINFVHGSTFDNNIIYVGNADMNEIYTIESGNIININYISPGIELSEILSVIRISDGTELLNNLTTFSGYIINLNSGTVGDEVRVIYSLKMNGAATPTVDYNRGNLYIDYSYLADEILVSYEYGDNSIDFRESISVDAGTTYYVTYKVGALRDSLYSNFGSLIDLPIMNSFDISFDREKYRDALQGALQSFTKGPTIPSMKSLVSNITKTEPEIIEAIFDIWSLGISNLYQNKFNVTGNPSIVSGKFDNGIYLEDEGDSVSFEASSNLRINEGTLELWVIPSWDGIDNDATLTFDSIKKDGYIVPAENIFIGANGNHPVLSNNTFSVNKNSDLDVNGIPYNIYTDTGIFIYYDIDNKKWNLLAKDVPDGYSYSGKIYTSGEFYNVKFIENTGEFNDTLRSLTNEIEFIFNIDSNDSLSPDGYSLNDGYVPGYSFDGINFMSDNKHYLVDLGKEKTKNRFSIYKDGRGYLNFEIFDNNNSSYKISNDISGWKAGEKHHIATSWKIDTYDEKDEMHLFIDGFEVPNILRYGGRPIASLSDRFRTIKPEIVAGTITRPIIKGNDLQTTIGSNIVIGEINFQAEGILPGDTINILEENFGTFNITFVNGQELTLDSALPTTLSNAKYSINTFSAIVSNEVYLSPNVSITIYDGYNETEMPGMRASFPSYSVDKNALLQTVLNFYGPASIGDQIYIRTLGLNHKRCRENVYLWSNQNIIKTKLPPPINLDEVSIIPIILPLTNINPNTASIVGPLYVISGLIPTEVSNTTEGRRLNIRITGGNVDFSTAVTATITGTSDSGTSEVLTFTSASTLITTYKWKTISDITVQVKPFNLTIPSISFEVTEAFSITDNDGNTNYPLIRYSFQSSSGNELISDGLGTLSNGYFGDVNIGDKIVVISPVSATYTISEITDENNIIVTPIPPSFSLGEYKIYNSTIGRSGFNNGYFSFELAGEIGTPYDLPKGFYKFDYSAYLKINFDNIDQLVYIGSDIFKKNQAMAVIDELRILSRMITDTRTGETMPSGQKSITSDAVTILPFESDKETLVLAHFDNDQMLNSASFYKLATKDFLQSSDSINDNFSQSIVINERPYIIDNKGYLNTSSEGTIEFWVSPDFDTFSDPNYRYYFDATSANVEQVTSLTNSTIKLSSRIYSIDSIRLITDADNNGINYAENAKIMSDFKTIKLDKKLPYQQTPVNVSYIPSGFSGDRISIFKDIAGYLNFTVIANEEEYNVRQPILWQKNSWHRIMVTYKFNRRDNRDEMRMFVDGREFGTIMFGQGLLFGSGFVFGQGSQDGLSRLTANIDFKDYINKIFIGSDYKSFNLSLARFDNLKISNISRNPLYIAGTYIDENYQSNLSTVLPVIEDLYTTYLMNFDTLVEKNEDFSILRDEYFGIFNFILNIIDSFNIISEDEKANKMLEELILALKPAQSKVEINILK